MARVVALLANDVGEEATARVYEPVADLVHGQAGLLGEEQLLILGGVGVVAVLVQPHLEHLDTVLGQVAAPLSVVGRGLCRLGGAAAGVVGARERAAAARLAHELLELERGRALLKGWVIAI